MAVALEADEREFGRWLRRRVKDRRCIRYDIPRMKRAVVVVLVVIVLMTGLPVLMNMGGMTLCSECAPGLIGPLLCLAGLAAASSLFAVRLVMRRFTVRERTARSRLLPYLFERPPQPTTA